MVDVVIESMVEMANVVVFSGDGQCSDSEYGGDGSSEDGRCGGCS